MAVAATAGRSFEGIVFSCKAIRIDNLTTASHTIGNLRVRDSLYDRACFLLENVCKVDAKMDYFNSQHVNLGVLYILDKMKSYKPGKSPTTLLVYWHRLNKVDSERRKELERIIGLLV